MRRRLFKTVAVLLLLFALEPQVTRQANRSPSGSATKVTFLQALRIYDGFASGLTAEQVAAMYGSPLTVTNEAEALEQLIALQVSGANVGLGAAPVEMCDSRFSGIDDRDRGSLDAFTLSHRDKAFREIDGILAKIKSAGYPVWESSNLLSCERCTLTSSCAEAEAIWKRGGPGTSPFLAEKYRESLRNGCLDQARWLIGEIERTGWGGDSLMDFSSCRKALATEPPFLCVSPPTITLGNASVQIHPSCLDDAADDIQWTLKIERVYQLHSAALQILDGCSLGAEDGGRPVLRALPTRRSSVQSFILLTCFPGGNRITDGQRGLINFDDALLSEMRPNRFEYTRKEEYKVQQSWPFSGERIETRDVRVRTTDPREIEANQATPERITTIAAWPTDPEARAIASYASLLATDALRNSPERFHGKNPDLVPQATAETLGMIWTLDCMKARPYGPTLYVAALSLPGATAALEACSKGSLPPLSDTKQNAAMQAACERLKAPLKPRPSPAPDDVD